MGKLRKIKMLFLVLILGVVSSLAPLLTAHADPLGGVTQYNIVGADQWITEASDGTLWTTNTAGQNGVVSMTKSGSSTVYGTTPLNRPYSQVAASSEGSVWFAGPYDIGTVNSQGTATSYSKPQSLWAPSQGIVAGPDGNIWFAIGDGSLDRSKIGRITPTGAFLPAYSMSGNPWFLVSDPANEAIWYSLRPIGNPGQSNKIGKFEMDGTQTEFTVPSTFGFNIFHMSLGPDGNIWFNSGAGKIGKMTPTGNFTIYDLGYTSADGLFRITSGLDGYIWATRKNGKLTRISTNGSATTYTIFPTSTPYATVTGGLVGGRDGNIWILGENGLQKLLLEVGTGHTDNDEDGVQYSQEVLQGTLDNDPDTDDDGLSDYVESIEYPVRNQVFCNESLSTCEYPDPSAKDLYIENDWMEKPGSSGYEMQLSPSQLGMLLTAFEDKGIDLHIDIGQLGGGTQVPYTSEIYFNPQSSTTDFYDYKLGGDGITAQMSALRKDIFHYLLTGQKFSEVPGSSGASFAGDDDLFVAYGNLKESIPASELNTAISGTVMHELGHGLCLTDENNGNPAYSGQPASCRFAGIDANAGPNYASVMNYDMQLIQVDYSDGINGAPDDHGDWSALRLADFTKSTAGDTAHGVTVKNPTFKHRDYKKRNSKNERPIVGPSVAKLKAGHR